MNGPVTTVGVLYPGELGAALAGLLAAQGARVVTTLQGRGAATARRARAAGIAVLDSLADVVRASDIVVSVVQPAAAAEVAAAYCGLARAAPPGALYVDLNSTGPELAAALAARVRACGCGFVDAAVNGLARNLAAGGTLFLSGPRAGEVARLVAGAMRVRVLGDAPGRASAMKMSLSGLSKGLCALFAETALVAARRGMLDEVIEAYRTIYPGVMAVVDRMLPTYARHAARRATETRELEQMARSAGLEPCVLAAVRELHEAVARVTFPPPPPADRPTSDDDGGGWDAAAVVERLVAAGLLSAGAAAGTFGTSKLNTVTEEHHGE
jgi:3-hydroxyisobutyrate dehydrogenase-like beta-hydroxyacid dehydrogenase